MRSEDEETLDDLGLEIITIKNQVTRGKISVVENSVYVGETHVAQFMKRDIKPEEVKANINLWATAYSFPLFALMLHKEDYKVKYRATFYLMIFFVILAIIGWVLFALEITGYRFTQNYLVK